MEVSWSAPPECPGVDDLRRRVEGFLGQPIDAPNRAALAICGSVTKEQESFVAAVTLSNEHGTHERRLEHDDCIALVEGAALVVALAIDPELVEAESQRQRAATPPVEEAAGGVPPAAALPELDPPPALDPVIDSQRPPRAQAARAEHRLSWRWSVRVAPERGPASARGLAFSWLSSGRGSVRRRWVATGCPGWSRSPATPAPPSACRWPAPGFAAARFRSAASCGWRAVLVWRWAT